MTTNVSPSRRIKVADFSTHVSGPTASMFLGSVGAEVVKIENPTTGDGNRSVPAAPYIEGRGIYHHALNAGAKSVAVSARSEEWPKWVKAMSQWADVVIVGGRPSDAARLGLSRETVSGYNPNVIYCHISGYGDVGPWSERAAHGQNPDALAGLVDLTTDEDGNPVPSGWRPAGTTFAGVSAALGVLAALWHRAERGVVTSVHTSLWESALWWNWRQVTAAINDCGDWGVIRDFGSRYATYGTSDGRAMLVAPIEEKFWVTFCELAGLDDLKAAGTWDADERYDFGEAGPGGPERKRIAEAMGSKTLDEWLDLLGESGIPFCEILDARSAATTPQAEATGMVQRYADGSGYVLRAPVRLDGTGIDQPAHPVPPPDVGDDTAEFAAMFNL